MKTLSILLIFLAIAITWFSCKTISKSQYQQLEKENETLKQELSTSKTADKNSIKEANQKPSTANQSSPTETFESAENKAIMEEYLNQLYAIMVDIREEPKLAEMNTSPAMITEQHDRLEELMKREKDSLSLEMHLYKLIEETSSLGGWFGSLDQQRDRSLIQETRKYSAVSTEARHFLTNKCSSIYIKNQRYETQPLIKFSERHGGPLHYDLRLIRVQFDGNDQVEIEVVDFQTGETKKHSKGQYKITAALPYFVYGTITLQNGKTFGFQTVRGQMEYLFLENPPMWKSSVVTKVK